MALTESINSRKSESAGPGKRRCLLCSVALLALVGLCGRSLLFELPTSLILVDVKLDRPTYSAAAWRALPVLTRRGAELDVPAFPHTVRHAGLAFVTDERVREVPRADGDEAMQHILDKIDIRRWCREYPALTVVDVGGLFGDFGLSAASRGCRVVIYEPQLRHSQQIARSVLLNKMEDKVKVHHAAISPKRWVSFVAGKKEGLATLEEASEDAKEKIPTERLDEEFQHDTILVLKVDVEGNEDEVWETASTLFREGRVLNAIFEYTPKQFEGRGTDYKTFLKRFYAIGAKQCYALHRKQPRVYKIPRGLEQAFYQRMFASSMQTDVFCQFGSEKVNPFDSAPAWSRGVSLHS